jgi:ferredoxin-NADP reductase/MOSC domain-containing protein YiiM
MARLLAVNVGLPRDIDWRGRVVHTAIWKRPVAGRCRARRLNLDGDGQGDVMGHGGEHRAVFVYQIESYRYWQEQLDRTDFTYGQFGENFTIEGMLDEEVYIGDRYQIESALFEVTQPRVTCYRVGIRMDEPRMAALLTSSGRPGFYLRVLQEGEIGAGDEIVKMGEATERMSVTDINALLYSSRHPREKIERALRIEALSPGWRSSFEAMLESDTVAGASGNAGLAPAEAAHPVAPGFAPLAVEQIERECADVVSLSLRPTTGNPLATPLPGQFVVLRLRPKREEAPFFRSYSLSGQPSSQRYRISVKIEPQGAAGAYLGSRVRSGDILDVSAPRGTFVLQSGDGPVALVSAGIGATPVLAMLHAMAAAASAREVWWLHGARNREHHPFSVEVRRLIQALTRGRSHVVYSQPSAQDERSVEFDGAGRLGMPVLDQLGIPRSADFYVCGPGPFMRGLTSGLRAANVSSDRIHTEIFGGGNPMTPGVVPAPAQAPHLPVGDSGTGPLVSFARSGIATRWQLSVHQSLLELAEACDVPVRWSCRTGVCHSCECGLISGSVAYDPEPLDAPGGGNLLICCSRPRDDVVIDL